MPRVSRVPREPMPQVSHEVNSRVHRLNLPEGVEVPNVPNAKSVEIQTAPVSFVRVAVRFDSNGVPIIEKAENGEYLLPEAGRVCVDGRTSLQEAMIRTGAYGGDLEMIIAFVEYLKELGIDSNTARELMPRTVEYFFDSFEILGVTAYMHTDDHAGEQGIGCGHFATNTGALPEEWQTVANAAYSAAKEYAEKHPNTLTNEVLKGGHGEAMVLLLDRSVENLAIARGITITTTDGRQEVKQAFVNNPTINEKARYVHAAILYKMLREAEYVSDEIKNKVSDFEAFKKRLEGIAATQRKRTNDKLVARKNLPILTVKEGDTGLILGKPDNSTV